MTSPSIPLVVQYLYVHDADEAFRYPTTRTQNSAVAVANRYLECALAQAASLRLREAECDLALATNIEDRERLGAKGAELIGRLESLGVAVLRTAYVHRPGSSREGYYVSSRYLLDAILAAAEAQPADRQLWLTDLDCIWVNPRQVFAAGPPATEVGCLFIQYPPWWDVVGQGDHGRSRDAIARLAGVLGGSSELPPWIGGELLAGTTSALRELVHACERLDDALAERDLAVPNEEQILTLAGAHGDVRFRDLSDVAGRIHTGRRHRAMPVKNALSLGLWHLPGEKGLSLRRAARDSGREHGARLAHDLADPVRAGRRFNVEGTGRMRTARDYGWIASQRVAEAVRSAVAGS